MSKTQTSPQTSRPQPQDELSDLDLEAVSAGSRPNCATPLNAKDANASSDFRRKN